MATEILENKIDLVERIVKTLTLMPLFYLLNTSEVRTKICYISKLEAENITDMQAPSGEY